MLLVQNRHRCGVPMEHASLSLAVWPRFAYLTTGSGRSERGGPSIFYGDFSWPKRISQPR